MMARSSTNVTAPSCKAMRSAATNEPPDPTASFSTDYAIVAIVRPLGSVRVTGIRRHPTMWAGAAWHEVGTCLSP
jgi:hypothetical protein